MRAAVYEAFGPAETVLRVEEVADRSPGPGEVRIRIHASGINPYDVKVRAGLYARAMPRPRVVPHCDGAGVIAETGPGVAPERIGERVWIWGAAQGGFDGTAAAFATLPDERAPPLPAGLSFEDGACLGIPYLTAWQNLLRDGPVDGRTVLVSGGGGAVGLLAVQIARLSGARVLATAGRPATIARARAAGAEAVIDHRQEDVAARVSELTGGAGVDRLIEVEFGHNLPLFTRVLRPGGIVSSYGSAAAMSPVLDFAALQAHGLTLHVRSVHRMDPTLRHRAIADLPGLVARGLALPPTERFALDGIAQAHRAVESGAGLARPVLTL